MVLLQRYKALSHNWLLFTMLYLVLHAEIQSTVLDDSYFQYCNLCCMVLLQWYKALSHNWLLLSVLCLVLHGALAEVQSTVPQLTLIVNALPCAACRGAKHCPRNDSYCQCFALCCMVLFGYKALSHEKIDFYCQCFTLWCMQRYKALS